jgi:integrase
MNRRKRLDDEDVAKLPVKAKRYALPDPEMRGHYVRVNTSGAKSFWVVARDPSGKQHWRMIGSPPMRIEDAREKALGVIKSLRQAAPDSFEDIATKWRKLHCEASKLRSLSEIDRYLKRMNDAWCGRDFASIGRADVTRLLDKIEMDSGQRAATYTLQTFSAMANWNAARNDHYRSPIVRGMRRGSTVKRERILSDDELRAVWKAAESNGTFGAFIRLALLTAQRRTKVAGMKWTDLDGNAWTIATEAREKGNAGVLVLPEAAMKIIEAQPRTSPYVLPTATGKQRVQWSGPKEIFTAKLPPMPQWGLHDLRRTARSLMSRAGVRPDIAERVMGHVQQGVESVYDRHSYREEKAQALRALAGIIETIMNPTDNVVAMRA